MNTPPWMPKLKTLLLRLEPYPTCLLTGTTAIGILGASLLHRIPPSAERVIPTWGLYLFFVTLAASSATVLIGMTMGTVRGMRVEQSGSLALAGLFFSFSAWTIQASGVAAYRSVIFMLMIMTAALWQAYRIHRALRPRKDSP